MVVSQIPNGTSHVFTNTKNKKSFYRNFSDGSWEIYNKGLDTWEKVPSLSLNLIPVDVFLNNETTNEFTDVEDTTISITNVTVREPNVRYDFAQPPITPEDYELIYDLFEKYSNGTPLGFINGEESHSVHYDHYSMKWYVNTSEVTEYLTVYTTNLDTAKKVVDELNASLLHNNLTK